MSKLVVLFAVNFPGRKIERSTDKIQLWLESQVAPSLAVLRYGWGQENFHKYLEGLCIDANSRLTGYHTAMIEELKGEVKCQR